MKEDQTAAAKAMIASAPDQLQLGLAEDLKGAMRRGAVDRAKARQTIQFLDQAAGKALLARLRQVRSAFADHKDDQRLADELLTLATEYRKPSGDEAVSGTIKRDDLRLVCFEYLSM